MNGLLARVYLVVAMPWLHVLKWLTELTGQRSTYFVRHGVVVTLLLTVFEIIVMAHSETPDRFTMFLTILFMPLAAAWTWRRARDIDRQIDAGEGWIALRVDDVVSVMIWVVVYSVTGYLTLVTITRDVFPLRAHALAATGVFLLTPCSGGTSAWQRFKERLRKRSLQPSTAKG